MEPVIFTQCNAVMGKDQPEYLPLPVCIHKDGQGHVTSCWRFTWKELFKVLFTGKIYLTLATFNSPIQPQKLTVYNPCWSK
jgi:hypothetical protein